MKQSRQLLRVKWNHADSVLARPKDRYTGPEADWIQRFNGRDLSGWTPKITS